MAHDDHPTADPTPPHLRRAIEILFRDNPYSAGLDIHLVEAERGRALLVMDVAPDRMNAHGSCHGGAVWTLADMAFGAAGFYDGTILTVGSDLTFIRPASAGTRLWAAAREITRKGKTGVFHLRLATDPDDDDTIVAVGQFTGRWLGGG